MKILNDSSNLIVSSTVIRLVTHKGGVYIYHYFVRDINSRNGRIMSDLPECINQGCKAARISQFNQTDHGHERILITVPQFYERDLRFFLRRTGRVIASEIYLPYRLSLMK